MPALPNFPMKSERLSPDPNAGLDCVPACVAAAMQYLTGYDYEPNEVKDAVYGRDYVGGTDAAAFTKYSLEHGVRLAAFNGKGYGLITEALAQLEAGHPVIVTEPNPYGNAQYSHVVCFYGWDDVHIWAMDPWTATEVTRSYQQWADLLLFNQIWIAERSGELVPPGWKDDGVTLTAPNGIHIVRGYREWVLNNPWNPNNIPLALEAGRNPLEIGNPSLGGGTWQPFRDKVLGWTQEKGVYEMWVGQELLAVYNLVAALQAQGNTSNVDKQEILASAKLIEDTAGHIMNTIAGQKV